MKFIKPMAAIAAIMITASMGITVHAEGAHHGHGTPAKSVQRVTVPKNAQKVSVTLPQGYKSGAATVQAGRPVALTFFLKSDAGCGNSVSVPAAKWSKSLKVGEKATVVYTPKKSGPLAFQCAMGMYKGTISVR